MRKPSLAIGVLVVSLLFSAWGNVIAASFCPRYGIARHKCLTEVHLRPTQVLHRSSCHQEMADMKMEGMVMDDMEMESDVPSESGADSSQSESQVVPTIEDSTTVALDLPIEQCGHCWMHSQQASGPLVVVAFDSSTRVVDSAAPVTNLDFLLPFGSLVSITPSEHGPPGNSFPRHVLLNVFRI